MPDKYEICQILGIPANDVHKGEEIDAEEVEMIANAWAELTGEEFEVEDDDLFKINLETLVLDIGLTKYELEFICDLARRRFEHLAVIDSGRYIWLTEQELQDFCEEVGNLFGLDFEIDEEKVLDIC